MPSHPTREEYSYLTAPIIAAALAGNGNRIPRHASGPGRALLVAKVAEEAREIAEALAVAFGFRTEAELEQDRARRLERDDANRRSGDT